MNENIFQTLHLGMSNFNFKKLTSVEIYKDDNFWPSSGKENCLILKLYNILKKLFDTKTYPVKILFSCYFFSFLANHFGGNIVKNGLIILRLFWLYAAFKLKGSQKYIMCWLICFLYDKDQELQQINFDQIFFRPNDSENYIYFVFQIQSYHSELHG